MTHPDPTSHPDPLDVMEVQLQQELRSMFDVDTEKGLQTYLDLATNLSPDTWTDDIQTLYRAIHTIKGGAVTVGADAILPVATVLEDMLSDLRHLSTAPDLADGHLANSLMEAGELLASTLSIEARGEAAQQQVEPTLQRLQTLRQQMQQQYLPQWSEQQQIQQEFAQQGLDLVILDLEIALEQSATAGTLSSNIIHTARNTLDQLYQIGRDLQLAGGWGTLLHQAETLLADLDAHRWQLQWPRLVQALKTCALQGGEPVPFDLDAEGAESQVSLSDPPPAWRAMGNLTEPPMAEPADDAIPLDALPETPDAAWADSIVESVLSEMGELFDAMPHVPTADEWVFEPAPADANALTDAADPTELAEMTEGTPWILHPDPEAVEDTPREPSAGAPVPLAAQPIPEIAPDPAVEQIQVPVPLAKLDQSAQDLVSTLLSVRSAQGIYQTLQAQVMQLVALAQEGVQHITRLRQIQDDYALIDNLRPALRDGRQGPTPERYRQGYTTINRLLETSLRLSELGAEAEKSSKQMAESLQFLDSNVLKLQSTVEESRMLPFSNLGFRARAILRDLTTRYGKPARLVIQGDRTELDVGTARTLEPALLHLIRNAFDHALEAPTERQAQGKPEQGTLTLSLQRRGNSYLLDVQDDGRGIDADTIRARATALNLPLTETDTPADLLAVICQPGFSSETEVSDLSGRGVGMDVVATQIAKLGGRLTLETELGQGTTFHLQFPVPHLLVPCVLLQAGDRTFAIPTEDIRTTALLESLDASPRKELDTAYSWDIQMGEDTVPGLDLMEYWQPQLDLRPLENIAVCAYIQSTIVHRGAWLIADELLGQSDLLITALPHPLQPPAGMMGVSLQPDGTLVPVLNATELVDWLHTAPADSIADLSGIAQLNLQDTAVYTPTILIVDDAALMRRRLEASLTAYGHLTHTCVDGLDAWNWLQTNPRPALIITDIEMPNMDGFTLIDRCRQSGIQTPILVVSSRLSEEWFTEARRLGATDYLTKGFSTLELVGKVEGLVGG